jgi:hypothetical protein
VSTLPEPSTAARAAAEWWAKHVGAPVHRLVRDEERSAASDFAEVGMLWIASGHPVPDGAATGFTDALEKLYDELLVKLDGRVSLGVDYGPDMELADVAKAHGIHPSRFPMKTMMWAYPDYVCAALGYGAPTRLVWAAPDWVRPTCYSVAFDQRTQRFGNDRCGLPLYHDGEHGDWQPDPRRCAGCGLTEGGHYNRPWTIEHHHLFEVHETADPQDGAA